MPRLKRGMTAENAAASSRQISTFPRRKSVRAVDRNSPSSDERAQGMPGEGLTHGPRAVKKHGEGTTGSAGSSGIPCATVLRLITRSPRRPGFLAPVISEIISRRLDLSVGRPGPHAFAVRADDARLASSSRPSHPRLTFGDDWPKRPLHRDGMHGPYFRLSEIIKWIIFARGALQPPRPGH